MYTHIYTHLQTYTLLQGSILTPIDTSLNEAPSNGYSSVELTPEQEAVLTKCRTNSSVLGQTGVAGKQQQQDRQWQDQDQQQQQHGAASPQEHPKDMLFGDLPECSVEQWVGMGDREMGAQEKGAREERQKVDAQLPSIFAVRSRRISR
jgi:hypothetical protein